MKMAENETPNIQSKAYILSFNYRRTGMGGFDDVILMSFRTKRPIKSILRTSKTGNHGTRSYRLFPGKYLMYEVQRSNGGNLYGFVKIIRLDQNGQTETEKEWQVFVREPTMSLDDLPQEIREILEANKEELPLFRQVFPFDNQQDNNQEGE
jgi:hypothetical protein